MKEPRSPGDAAAVTMFRYGMETALKELLAWTNVGDTPALVVLLGVTAGIGSVLLGVVLLFAFAVGRAVPIALGAFAVSWLENLKSLSRYRRGFEIAGGLTLIVMGLYMLNAVLF